MLWYIASTKLKECALSSVGRATRLHREGRGFESLSAHQNRTQRFGKSGGMGGAKRRPLRLA
jgi:hypothetical protein